MTNICLLFFKETLNIYFCSGLCFLINYRSYVVIKDNTDLISHLHSVGFFVTNTDISLSLVRWYTFGYRRSTDWCLQSFTKLKGIRKPCTAVNIHVNALYMVSRQPDWTQCGFSEPRRYRRQYNCYSRSLNYLQSDQGIIIHNYWLL